MVFPTPQILQKHLNIAASTDIYQAALHLANLLNTGGYQTVFIGGAIRDLLLGLQPQDYDLATQATPSQIKAILGAGQAKYIDTYQAYGVSQVRLFNWPTVTLELTTFRKDQNAQLGRKNTTITFSDLQHDALRRDLTINALAYNPTTKEFFDYVGGQADLESKVIRFIGDPQTRITEDPLRVLRAIRFKNQLGFTYHPDTRHALEAACRSGFVQQIAPDRIGQELTKMITAPYRTKAVADLEATGILALVLPELFTSTNQQPTVKRSTRANRFNTGPNLLAALAKNTISKQLAWAALLQPAIPPGASGMQPAATTPKQPNTPKFDRSVLPMVATTCQRFGFSKKLAKQISWLITASQTSYATINLPPRRQAIFFEHPLFEDLMALLAALASTQPVPPNPSMLKNLATMNRLWQQHKQQPPQPIPSLKQDLGIDGHWVQRLLGPSLSGKQIGLILDQLTELYLDTGSTSLEFYQQTARQLAETFNNPSVGHEYPKNH